MTFVRFPGDKSRSMRCDERSITPDRPFTPHGVYSAISLVAIPLAPRFDSADCTRRGCLSVRSQLDAYSPSPPPDLLETAPNRIRGTPQQPRMAMQSIKCASLYSPAALL